MSEREKLRQRVKADLMAGVEGAQLYDAWGGAGFWTPVVKLTERDAGIVAAYVARLLAEAKS
jgi:predicted methyltransferase